MKLKWRKNGEYTWKAKFNSKLWVYIEIWEGQYRNQYYAYIGKKNTIKPYMKSPDGYLFLSAAKKFCQNLADKMRAK